MFDCAVLQGPKTAIKLMQRALAIKDDGQFGPITLAAIRAADPHRIVPIFLGRRVKRLTELPHWPTFANGWSIRLFRLQVAALK
jgi:lysozyme family protein